AAPALVGDGRARALPLGLHGEEVRQALRRALGRRGGARGRHLLFGSHLSSLSISACTFLAWVRTRPASAGSYASEPEYTWSMWALASFALPSLSSVSA